MCTASNLSNAIDSYVCRGNAISRWWICDAIRYKYGVRSISALDPRQVREVVRLLENDTPATDFIKPAARTVPRSKVAKHFTLTIKGKGVKITRPLDAEAAIALIRA